MANEYLREVTLPSRGLPYAGSLGDGTVVVEPWDTQTEKLIAGGAGVRDVLNGILTRHVKPAGTDRWPLSVKKLTVVDRLYLLFQVRMATFPKHPYGFRIPCSGCGRGVDMEVALEERETLYLDPDYMEDLLVDVAGSEVQLRLLTGEDEDAIAKMAKRRVRAARRRNKDADDEEYVLTLARHIHTIDGGAVDLGAALMFIEQLRGGDLLEIKDALEALEFGLDGEVVAECARCGMDTHTAMPFSDEFFRPRGPRTKRRRSSRRDQRAGQRGQSLVRGRDGDAEPRASLVAERSARQSQVDPLAVRAHEGSGPVKRTPSFGPG